MRRILADAGFNVCALPTYDPARAANSDGGPPNLVIIEAHDMDVGVAMCATLKATVPGARLVLITEECDLGSIPRALAAGVDGLLNNTIACEPLVAALGLIMMGEKVVPTQVVNALTGYGFPSQPHVWDVTDVGTNLSERETEILQQLVLGEANKVISRRLMISEATVKVHVKAILRKLHVLNRTQAAIWAVHRGITARDSHVSHRVGANDLHVGPGIPPRDLHLAAGLAASA
ncbi:LuxR C-terminal-related transcriptional regulator [Glacieibacterium sp.]|uniref:LuxR C-terminal-related transcriptional regulator n=1 Tax=Glacieibacterium sp. TaxID=2860237 RepID=UPI003B00D092